MQATVTLLDWGQYKTDPCCPTLWVLLCTYMRANKSKLFKETNMTVINATMPKKKTSAMGKEGLILPSLLVFKAFLLPCQDFLVQSAKPH